MADANQIEGIKSYILTGAYINCSTGNCNEHDIEESCGDEAAELFFDKGWRYIDKAVYCPDCSRKKGYDVEEDEGQKEEA